MALRPITRRQLFASIVASALVAFSVAAYLATGIVAHRYGAYDRAIDHLGSEVMVRPVIVGVAVFLGLMFVLRLIFHDLNRHKNP